MIPNIGPLEIVIVLGVVLAVFGPKRLPELGSGLGRGINSFRRGIDGKDEPASAVAVAPAVGPVAKSREEAGHGA